RLIIESLARFDKWKESSQNLAKLSLYERFVKAGKMHEVPPPITGTFMPTSYKYDLTETQATFGSKSNTSSLNTSNTNDFVSCDNSDKSSASETSDIKSCVLSPKTNDSFTVDVKILPKSDVKDPSPTNGFPSCSFKENVKPTRNLCIKSGLADRIHCKNNFVCSKKCFVFSSKSHLIKDCDVYDNVDNFPFVVLKAPSVPAGSRNSSASTSAGRSIPAASRHRPASIHAGRPIHAASRNRPYLFMLIDPFLMIVETDQHLFMLVDIFMLVKGGTVTFGGGDGKITGKGTIRTSKLNFENIYYVEELQNFILFSVSQICDKKNKVLFTDDECLVLTKEFQLPDESQVVIRITRRHDLYTFNLSDIQPEQHINCLLAKASLEESTKWHRRMAHVNFKTINKLAKHGLVKVTILNTSGHLRKFEGKANDNFLVGYAAHSKAYRVYNLSSKKVEETLNLRYLEDKPNVQGLGQEWYFDLNYLTDSLGYTCFKTKPPTGPKVHDGSAPMENNLDYAKELARLQRQEHEAHSAAVKYGFEFSNETAEMFHQANIETYRMLVLAAGDPVGSIVSTGGVPAGSIPTSSVPAGSVPASHVPASSIPAGGVLAGSIDSARVCDPIVSESVPAIFTTDHAVVSPLPPSHSLGSSEHSTRFPSPSDHGNHQPTAVIFSSSSYDDDFCTDVTNLASNVAVDPVATKRVNIIHPQSHIIGELQIEAIRIFLAFASYMGFIVYQMDVKSAFLYEEIKEEVRGTIDKTLFLKKDSRYIILIQVYVDDIIFCSTNKAWCDEFEVLMKGEFKMSVMGEFTFFLGLQVKQLPDGIFISQDKYVMDMLKKFDTESMRTATTPYEVPKHKSKDEPDDAVNVHLYRSMIGSLMYLTAFRPDIMFAVSACSRHQLEAYSDSDYAGSHGDRKSTTGGCQFMGRRLISWQCKKQIVVATSSTEAKYVAAASYCGRSTIYIVKNSVFHQRTKHIEIRHHFIRDANEKNLIQVYVYILTHYCRLYLVYCRMTVVSCGFLLYDVQIVGRPLILLVVPVFLLVVLVPADGRVPTGSGTIPTGSSTIPTGSCTLPIGSYSFMLLGWVTSLENELGVTKKVLGGAVLKLVTRVKQLEGLLQQKKQRLVLSDSEGDFIVEAAYTIYKASQDAHASSDAGHATAEVPDYTTMPFSRMTTAHRRLRKPFTSSASEHFQKNISAVEDTLPAGEGIPAAAPTIPAGEGIPTATDKGKAPMVDDSLLANLLFEQERILKNLYDYQLGEEVASPAEQGTGLSDQCRRELVAAQLIYTEADWLELMAKIATNSALSKQLLGDDRALKRSNLHKFKRTTFKPAPSLEAPSAKRARQEVPQDVLAASLQVPVTLSVATDVSVPAVPPDPAVDSAHVDTEVHTDESNSDDTTTASEQVSAEHTVAASTPSASDSDDDPLPYAPYVDWEMVPSLLGSIHAYYDMEGHTKHFTSLRELLHMVEKNDLRRLLGAVDNLYQREEPDTFSLLLWGRFARVVSRMLKHGLEVPKLLVGGDLTMAEQLVSLIKAALLAAQSAT
nr:putative ribonuclease H-like domain-containing protein [Tanacetum cinerariifolium]